MISTMDLKSKLEEKGLVDFFDSLCTMGFSHSSDFLELKENDILELTQSVGMKWLEQKKLRNLINEIQSCNNLPPPPPNIKPTPTPNFVPPVPITTEEMDLLLFFSTHKKNLQESLEKISQALVSLHQQKKDCQIQIETEHKKLIEKMNSIKTQALVDLETHFKSSKETLEKKIIILQELEKKATNAEEECQQAWQTTTMFSQVEERKKKVFGITSEIFKKVEIPYLQSKDHIISVKFIPEFPKISVLLENPLKFGEFSSASGTQIITKSNIPVVARWVNIEESPMKFSNNAQTARNTDKNFHVQPFGTTEPIQDGKWKFMIRLDSAKPNTTMEIGVCLHTELINIIKLDSNHTAIRESKSIWFFSWNNGNGKLYGNTENGHLTRGYHPGDVVSMIIDIPSGTLSFFKDNSELAKFTNLPRSVVPIAYLGANQYDVQVTILSVDKVF